MSRWVEETVVGGKPRRAKFFFKKRLKSKSRERGGRARYRTYRRKEGVLSVSVLGGSLVEGDMEIWGGFGGRTPAGR